MRRSLAAVAVMLLALSVGATEPVSRLFTLRHRNAQDAATFVASLLSSTGTVLIQPGKRCITVHDEPAVIEKVSAALQAWDVPPVAYRVRVQVFLAYSGELAKGKEPAKLPGLNLDLFRLFHFSSYQPLDDLRLVAANGSSVETNISDRYTLRFGVSTVAQDPDRLQLKPLELLRREQVPSGIQGSSLVLRTVVSLTTGQVGIVAAAQSELADRALLLVMTATRTDGQAK